MSFKITPPAAMDTPEKRAAWATRWQENLRIAHNWMGAWFTSGKTRAQYNNALRTVNNMVTRRIRAHYPFPDVTSVPDGEKYYLPEYQFREFQDKHMRIHLALHQIVEENKPNVPVSGMDDPVLQERQAFFDAAKDDATFDAHDSEVTDPSEN